MSESAAGAIITVAVAVGAVGSTVLAAVLEGRGVEVALLRAALVGAVVGCLLLADRTGAACRGRRHGAGRPRDAHGAALAARAVRAARRRPRSPVRRRCCGWPATSAAWSSRSSSAAWSTTRRSRSCCSPPSRSSASRWSAGAHSGSPGRCPTPTRSGRPSGDRRLGGLVRAAAMHPGPHGASRRRDRARRRRTPGRGRRSRGPAGRLGPLVRCPLRHRRRAGGPVPAGPAARRSTPSPASRGCRPASRCARCPSSCTSAAGRWRTSATSTPRRVAGALATGTHGTGAAFGNLLGPDGRRPAGHCRRLGARPRRRTPSCCSRPASRSAPSGCCPRCTCRRCRRSGCTRSRRPARSRDVLDDLDDARGRARPRRALRRAVVAPGAGCSPPGVPTSRPTHRTRWRTWLTDELLANRGPRRAAAHRSAAAARRTRSIGRLTGVAASAQQRLDDSHRVFASRRRVRFTESEWALPRAAVAEAVAAVLALIERRRLPVTFPIEVRFAAADDALLSTAHGRDDGVRRGAPVRRLPTGRRTSGPSRRSCSTLTAGRTGASGTRPAPSARAALPGLGPVRRRARPARPRRRVHQRPPGTHPRARPRRTAGSRHDRATGYARYEAAVGGRDAPFAFVDLDALRANADATCVAQAGGAAGAGRVEVGALRRRAAAGARDSAGLGPRRARVHAGRRRAPRRRRRHRPAGRLPERRPRALCAGSPSGSPGGTPGRIVLMVDSVEGAAVVARRGARPGCGCRSRSTWTPRWRPVRGVTVGALRSPVRTPGAGRRAGPGARRRPAPQLVALMAYEAPGRRRRRQRARPAAAQRRGARHAGRVDARAAPSGCRGWWRRCGPRWPARRQLELVNGGGTGSLARDGGRPARSPSSPPGRGSTRRRCSTPTARFRCGRRRCSRCRWCAGPAPGVVTVLGGGYVASGPPGGTGCRGRCCRAGCGSTGGRGRGRGADPGARAGGRPAADRRPGLVPARQGGGAVRAVHDAAAGRGRRGRRRGADVPR